MIDGVAGVILWTGDLEALTAFYRETLGLTPNSVRPDFVSFRWGDVRLGLGRHDHIDGPTREPYRVMINLGVGDIHVVHRDLTAKGVKFIRPPEQEHWGGWVATFQDLDGNVLQLIQLHDVEGNPYQTYT